MSRYVVTPPARSDLLDTWKYIAENASIDRADRIIRELHEAMGRIAEMPGVGHARKDLADETLRVFTVYRY